VRRPVLVAFGLRHDGKKEVIDFRLAQSESAAEWERFLGELIGRGLVADRLEMICVDGGAGLLAALPTAYPGVPVQRCWAHKIRNVLGKVRAPDQPAVKADLHAIMTATSLPRARSAARRFADRWTTIIRARSPACATISRAADLLALQIADRAAKPSARPTPLNGASAKCDGAPGPWACSRIEPRWIAFFSPSSITKTTTRASAPLYC
jgi:putative transposase